MATYLEGLRQTVRDLEDLGIEVDELKDVMGDIAAKAADVMQGHIPARNGTLRASARGNRAKGKAVVTIGKARVPYAAPINYGWAARNIPAADFTGKTDRAMDDTAVQMLQAGIDKLITKKGLDS